MEKIEKSTSVQTQPSDVYHSLGAGRSFMKSVTDTPNPQWDIENANKILTAFKNGLEAIHKLSESDLQRQSIAKLFQDYAKQSVDHEAMWKTQFGRPYPRSIEDWEHLARIVEMPRELILNGNFTCADVHNEVIAWSDRLLMERHVLAADGEDIPVYSKFKRSGWTMKELVDEADISDSTFRKIRKNAGMAPSKTGGSGQHRLFNSNDLESLVSEVQSGTYRNRIVIAMKWSSLMQG